MQWFILLSLIAGSWASVEENAGVYDPNLFEGDMVLTPEQRQAALSGGDVSQAGARGSIKRGMWPRGVLYYTIDRSLSSSSRAMNAIRAGMKMWEDNTCITFVKRTNQRNYANFYKGGGCSSYVGMTGSRQQISLAGGCWYAGIVAHEIGHALGFYHEQSRPDRDEYVTIIWNNIQSSMRFNFKKYGRSTIDSLGTPYDYASIMHYGLTAFGNGRVTIRPKKSGVTLGNRRNLSPTDIKQMNLLYKCSGGGGGGGGGVTPQPPTQGPQPPGNCQNGHSRCDEWANRGECKKNPGYMLRNCKKSCGVCGNVRCEDYHSRCMEWANRGECANPKYKVYMATWCRKSCKQCGGGPMPPTPAPPTGGPVPPTPPTPLPPTNGPPVPGSCGAKPNVRIVGGTEAPKNAWPWQAMLTTSSGGQFCGGTLISPMWVLSASHCVSGKRPSSIRIRMGAHYKRGSVGTEQDIKVQRIVMHPSYNDPKRYAHDIALIKLASPARLNKAVGIACLPPDDIAGLQDGKKCWITGWGRLSSGGASTNVLMQASVPIKSHSACQRSYPGSIHESMVCAGLDQGGIDTCQGDSGGPMVCEHSGRFYIEGATSWGHGCASRGKFGVYAKVRYVRSWILQTMKTY